MRSPQALQIQTPLQTNSNSSTLAFTAAELTHFFENATQMGLTRDTRLAIVREGIPTMDDVAEVTEKELKLVVENLRKPSGIVRDPEQE